MPACQFLVDDEDGLCLLGIGIAEQTPAKKRNPHRLEVVTAHDADPGARPVLGTRVRTPHNLEQGRETDACHGQVVGGSNGAHAGQILDAF
jgi:hypothetical protein